MSKDRNSDPQCGICGKTNHLEKYCWKTYKCKVCNKLGHPEKYCHDNRQNNYSTHHQHRQQNPQATLASKKKAEDHLFLAFHMKNEKEEDSWFIDSACTNHMTSKEEIFCNLNSDCKASIKMGNGEMVSAKGIGTIAVQTKKGLRYIDNVLLVPGLSSNLLSVGQMVQNGYSLIFKDHLCMINDSNNAEIACVPTRNKNFSIYWQNVIANAAEVKLNESDLWHKRYGHHNFKSLSNLHTQGLVRDLPTI
jgi:hypothetical protein